MSERYTAPKLTGLSCDATGCTEQLNTERPLDRWTGELKLFMIRADAAGWRVYVSRSRRVYCPAHGPKPGHKMRPVTP